MAQPRGRENSPLVGSKDDSLICIGHGAWSIEGKTGLPGKAGRAGNKVKCEKVEVKSEGKKGGKSRIEGLGENLARTASEKGSPGYPLAGGALPAGYPRSGWW